MAQSAFSGIVHGIVQGVGFRYFTMRQARALGVKGSVRNRADGTVEVHAEGERGELEQLVRDLHSGPPGSVVERVEVTWGTPTGGYGDFSIDH